jgi:hypothetical protein
LAKIASLSARPAFDQGEIDRAVEAAVARTSIQMRAEFDRALEPRLEEKERLFEERVAEFERRAVANEARDEIHRAAATRAARAEGGAERARTAGASIGIIITGIVSTTTGAAGGRDGQMLLPLLHGGEARRGGAGETSRGRARNTEA